MVISGWVEFGSVRRGRVRFGAYFSVWQYVVGPGMVLCDIVRLGWVWKPKT